MIQLLSAEELDKLSSTDGIINNLEKYTIMQKQ